MSLALTPPRVDETAKPLPFGRWLALGGLLLVEVVALTLRFDTGTLAQENGLWAVLLGEAHHVPHLAIAIGSALLLFCGGRLREELQRVREDWDRSVPVWPYLLAHALAFAAFAWVTGLLLEGGIQFSEQRGAWAIGWLVLGLCVVLFLGLVALPPAVWLRLARRALLPLAAGIAIGAFAWGAGLFTDRLWPLLGESTLWIVYHLLGAFFPEVVLDAGQFIVGTPDFSVVISPECSGYEGMGLIWAFLGCYLWLFRARLRFPQALLLLPLGTAAVYLLNAVRIVALVAVGNWVSPDVATGGFHSQAGWLAFNGVALGLVLLTRRWEFITIQEKGPAANPSVTYLAPFLALVMTVMLTAAFVNGFDWLYPLRVAAVALALWCFRREYGRISWSWSWSAVGLGIVVFVIWLALEPLTGEAITAAGLPSGVAGGWIALWLLFRVLGSVVTVPLAEELAFRGYLTRRLQAREFQDVAPGRFTLFSFLLSSVLFGVLHGRWLAGAVAGMLYALALHRRGKLGDPVIAHATTNALLAVYVLATGSWSLWA